MIHGGESGISSPCMPCEADLRTITRMSLWHLEIRFRILRILLPIHPAGAIVVDVAGA